MTVRAPILIAALAALAMPAAAHHSGAMFDAAKNLPLQGTVKSFKWTNPHAWLELDVPGAGGASDQWAIEMNSPNALLNKGWKRTSFKPGDKVKVVVHPLRDGKKGGTVVEATIADGTTLKG
jgi:hypothetical protein